MSEATPQNREERNVSETEPRLRTRRLRIDDLKLGRVNALLQYGAARISASVEDLSPHGAALVVDAAADSGRLFLVGDRIESIHIECAGECLYDGAALVRRVAEDGTKVVVGIELASQSVNLAELYRRGTRHSFAERLSAVDGALQLDEIAPEFKAYVADLRSYLEAMKTFLTKEEDALRGEDQLSRDDTLRQYMEEVGPYVVERINHFAGRLNRLVEHLSESQHVAYRGFARLHIMPLFLESPFIRRAYEKPLGYAGDYEMMNMLYRDHAEGDSLFGKVVNLYATQEGAARANINRITFLGAEIEQLINSSTQHVRLASIGCGPTYEIRSLLESSPALGPGVDIALIDQEERSIAYCERTLGPLAVDTGARIDFIRESIRRLVATRRLSDTLGQRAFIYSAGLFDYLSEATFARLLATLYEALVPGGVLLIGNVATHNPSRWSMEYYLDWFLIHRSADELLAFGNALEPRAARIEVQSEPTGINLFLRIVK